MKHSSRLVGILVALVASCYVHGHYESFVFDDITLIQRNEAIKNLDYLPGMLGLGKGHVPAHRVVRTLTYALDYHIWGNDPRGYHLTNILIHLLNTILVLSLGRWFLSDDRIAFMAALLWAIHPVHTEAVTYLSGRRDVLCAFFYLWGFHSYVRWRFDAAGRRFLWGCCAAYVLACFTKELAVTLPGVIGLLELVMALRARVANIGSAWRLAGDIVRDLYRLLARAPAFFGFLGIFPMAFTVYVFRFHPFNIGQHYLTPALPTDVLTLAKVGVHYLYLLLFPLHLSMDYFPESLQPSSGIGEPETLFAIGLLVTLSLLVMAALRRRSMVSFPALWFIVTFLPMSNLFFSSNEPVAEHYLYLPSVGFFWCAASGMASIEIRWPSMRQPMSLAIVCCALALGIRTDLRNRDWEDPVRIFQQSLEVFPRNSRLWNNLACHYLATDRIEEGLAAAGKAVALSPRESLYHYNRAFALRKLKRYQEAQWEYLLAVKEVPDYGDALLGMAFNQILLKDFRGALVTYDRALPLKGTREWYIHHWKGVTYREMGRFSEARKAFGLALEMGKRHPETLWQLALLAQAQARNQPDREAGALRTEAEALLREALQAQADSAVLHGVLGDLHREARRPDKALACYESMARVNTDFAAEAALRRARVHRDLGDRNRARVEYAKAVAHGFTDPEMENYLESPRPQGSSPAAR